MLEEGGGVSHPLQLTTGLVINNSVTTNPTLASECMLLIPKASILSEQTVILIIIIQYCCQFKKHQIMLLLFLSVTLPLLAITNI